MVGVSIDVCVRVVSKPNIDNEQPTANPIDQLVQDERIQLLYSHVLGGKYSTLGLALLLLQILSGRPEFLADMAGENFFPAEWIKRFLALAHYY